MKIKHWVTASAALLMAVSFALPAAAAEVGKTTTEGDVTFKGADSGTEGGNPTAPDDKDGGNTVTPDPGENSHTNGPLRIESVPTLHFGTQEVSTKDKYYNSLWNTGTVDGGTSTNIPVFAQVRDETAQATNSWTLSLQQTTAFSPSDTASTAPDLANTRVQIYAATAYNSLKANTSSTATATALTIGSTGYTTVSATLGEDLTIMTGANTNGSDSSLVFSSTSQYNPNDTTATNPYAVTGTTNEGLKLFVPGTDVAYAEEYTATFTWTLADAL